MVACLVNQTLVLLGMAVLVASLANQTLVPRGWAVLVAKAGKGSKSEQYTIYNCIVASSPDMSSVVHNGFTRNDNPLISAPDNVWGGGMKILEMEKPTYLPSYLPSVAPVKETDEPTYLPSYLPSVAPIKSPTTCAPTVSEDDAFDYCSRML